MIWLLKLGAVALLVAGSALIAWALLQLEVEERRDQGEVDDEAKRAA